METDSKIAVSLPPVPPPAPPNGSDNAFPRVRPLHGRTSGPTRRSTRGQWTPEEDELLRKAVQRFKGKNWKKIAECFKERTDVQCLHRWQKVLNPELIKGPWSKEEDEIIVQLVHRYGPKKWSTIAQHLPGRIGKQCRERWHNHLNPSINKEAWTQEEELILIRAHQIHGNRWAELTKYLPGRTDNSIKNHWNSSVKKKLDSFIASGLLSQFQDLPIVGHQNQAIPRASLRVHCSSGDGSVCKGGADAEENSESSQVGCSQTASDMSNTACQTREEFTFSEELNYGKVQSTSPTRTYSAQYCTSLDDVTFATPDMPCDFSCSPKFLDENFSKVSDYANSNCSFDPIVLQNIALELAANSSNLSGLYVLADVKHDRVHGPSHLSTGFGESAFVNNTSLESEFSGLELKAQEGCVGYPSSVNLSKSSDIINVNGYSDSLGFQSSFQASEVGGTVTLPPYDSLNTAMREPSECQNLSSFPSELLEANNSVICTKEFNQRDDSLTVSQAQEVVANAVLNDTCNQSSSPCHGHADVRLSEQIDLLDSSKAVPVNTISLETSDSQQSHTSEVRAEENNSKEEGGSLCYEPPRFPSLDIPFVSCDLAQSSADVQQDFSPLGIRQLMMSSMHSLSPFKLWDSPPSDDSPDAVLKSAARTFACTPSILKKRHRDHLSPLSPFSERRYGKKIGSDINQGFLCSSRLTKEFSRLDVMVDDDDSNVLPSTSHNQNNTSEASIEDKENICPAFIMPSEKAKHSHDSEDMTSEMEANKTNMEGKDNVTQDSTVRVSETRGILVECGLDATHFSSPDGVRREVGIDQSGASEVHQKSQIDSANFTTSESLGQKKTNDSVVSLKHSASVMSSMIVDSLVNEVGAENLNIFGGTPFRRSIESPSAWKSPWYFSSLVPCSRYDPDIMLEDIGIFMSPGERSIDAIGLMKQINEQGADAYADAKKVLGNDTPESILKQRCFRNQCADRETKNIGDSQTEGRLRLATNVSTERRILDFSECGMPTKSVEKGKYGNGSSTNLSSPSCLLKSYR